jgi:hypothetical protein
MTAIAQSKPVVLQSGPQILWGLEDHSCLLLEGKMLYAMF